MKADFSFAEITEKQYLKLIKPLVEGIQASTRMLTNRLAQTESVYRNERGVILAKSCHIYDSYENKSTNTFFIHTAFKIENNKLIDVCHFQGVDPEIYKTESQIWG